MFRLTAIFLFSLATVATADTFILVDQTNPLAVDLSQGKYTLPPDVKANPQDYIVFCDPEPCTDDSIRFKPILSIMDCGPGQYETGREDMEFLTADGGLFCALAPRCEPLR